MVTKQPLTNVLLQAGNVVGNFMSQPLRLLSTLVFLTISLKLFAQTTQIDTSYYSYQTVSILKKNYHGFLTANGFKLLNSKNEIFLEHAGDYFSWEFKDFNKDGYKDIFLDHGGNTPGRFDLLLYIPATKSFRQIKDFESFPDPAEIIGTKYFYSYHRSGCADMNWDSDLFYIKNYKAIRVANISGCECGKSGIKDGLYISRIRGEKKILFKTLPIETIYKNKGDKWKFIKVYWAKNNRFFM